MNEITGTELWGRSRGDRMGCILISPFRSKFIISKSILRVILLIVGILLIGQSGTAGAQKPKLLDEARALALQHSSETNQGVRSNGIPLAEDSGCGEPLRIGDPGGRRVELEECYRHVFSYDGTEKKIVVYYTLINGRPFGESEPADRLRDVDTDGDGINDLPPEGIAINIARWTEEAWRKYLDYGFNDPLGRDDFDVYVFEFDKVGWCCGPREYAFSANTAIGVLSYGGDPSNGMEVAFHEMWHASEASGTGQTSEGIATSMSDHVNIPVDLDDDVLHIIATQDYLLNTVTNSLPFHDYVGSLWWTYFMEQIGTVTAEPNRGVDAILQLWRNMDAYNLATVDNVIRTLPDDRTFETVWIDFTVANYAKELTGSGVPDKYKYQDELQAGAPDYPAVRMELDRSLSVGDGIIESGENIQPWAAKYYQVHPDPAISIINVDFRLDIPSNRAAFTLLAIRDDGIALKIPEIGAYTGGHFVQSFANDSYDRIVVIVTGLQERANFRYSFNAAEPVLNIIDPLRSRKAQAGDPSRPEKILIKVEVLSPVGGGTPVAGIDPSDFTITVGSQEVGTGSGAGEHIASEYIQGQYWFLIRAPSQSAEGDYNLRVEFATLSDTETGAVRYQSREDADNVLIIDRSGSMNDFSKMTAAQNAARLYVDSWREGDEIGVVSFSRAATVDLMLQEWEMSDGGSRDDAIDVINDLVAGGATSIGDGLISGLNELVNRGDEAHDWGLILLSDGMENEAPLIDDFMDDYDTLDKKPVVHTIALGPDADRARLERLARDTGGSFHYAAEPSSTTRAASLLSADVVDLPNDLAEIYRIISESVAHQQQVYSARDIIRFGETVTHVIAVDGGASEAVFVLNWDGRVTLSAEVNLYRPDGTLVQAPALIDSSHYVWRIPTPMAGEWLMTLGRQNTCEFCASTYMVEAALKSDLTMDVFLGLAVEDRLMGRPMPILVSLSDNQSIPGAVVNVQITDPEGGLWTLALYDDGLHGDGSSGDGFYGNTFSRTYLEGGYIAVVTAQGTSTAAGDFQRRLRVSFNMDGASDQDQDGVPDWVDPAPDRADATEDPDQDGVINIEEFRYGTDPRNADTDNGGESDGSELENASDPLEPTDDQISCILDFQATNVLRDFEDYANPRGSVLHFSIAADHDHFVLWRATNPEGPWQIINDQVKPTGRYIDDQVTLGVTYHYLLQAVDREGHKSCILGPRSTTPKADSVPPVGYVLINGGAGFAPSVNSVLTLVASSDTVDMIVSNSLDFVGASWEPYQIGKPWQLEPQDAIATVYVRYRDAAGNESEIFSDSIELAILIEIDIKPGQFPNRIRFEREDDDTEGDGGRKVRVAILSTPDLGALDEVDPETLTFGHSGNENSLHRRGNDQPHCSILDVNQDGRPDLVCSFLVRKTGFRPQDTVGILKGKTRAGAPFEAQDSVVILIGPERP